jgi:hypothetical protein
MASCTQLDPDHELQANKGKWEAAAISSYELDMRLACFCLKRDMRPIHVLVRGSETTFTYKDDDSRVTDAALDSLLIGAVPKMFNDIKLVIDKDPVDLRVVYNEEYGYPERIIVDPGSSISDDEFGLRVSDFEIIDDL